MTKRANTGNTPDTPEDIKIDPRSIGAFTLHAQGLSKKEVAGAYGVSVRTINRWIESINDKTEDVVFPAVDAINQRFKALLPKAIDTIEELMTSRLTKCNNPSVALKASEHVLKTHDVVKDKHVLQIDDKRLSDAELLEEFENLTKGKNE